MQVLFSIFSSLSLVCGTMVIRCRNPVHSVLFLILAFISASALLLLADLDFFAMVYLVVYVGAIAVLFLFVVMMLNIRTAVSDSLLPYFPVGALIGFMFLFQVFFILDNQFLPQIGLYTAWQSGVSCSQEEYLPGRSESFLLFLLGISQIIKDFVGLVFEQHMYTFTPFFQGITHLYNQSYGRSLHAHADTENLVSYVYWLDQSRPVSNIEALGEVLYTYYFVYFLLASLILLIAMVGGITLTMHKGAQVQKQEIAEQNRRDPSKTVAKIRS